MIIKRNYDLVEKIEHANNGVTFNHAMKYTFAYIPIAYTTLFSMLLMQNRPVDEAFLKELATITASWPIVSALATISSKLHRDNAGYDSLQIFAEEELESLTSELQRNDIKTDYELLLQAKEHYEERKYTVLYLNNKLIPRIIQSKYILVPINEFIGDARKRVYLKQTHQAFPPTKEYTFSLGEPQKTPKLTLAKVTT